MDSDTTILKTTALNEVHKKLGAKMVPFAGFEMPIVYSSIMDEHKCVRNSVGMFDVSHMGEFIISGEKALDLVQKITTNDASKLEPGKVQYSAMCYPDGGIIDDLLVYCFDDHYMMVVNASNIEKDFNWVVENNIEGADAENISDDITLLAVQGPKSLELVSKLTDTNVSELKYYHFVEGRVADKDAIISRTGYTGELGVELYMHTNHSETVWNAVMEAGKPFGIKPIGLGARDTLRLEKNMCLYGNDIDKDTNPIEAGLGWITKLDKGEFIGSDVLRSVKESGAVRKLIGFTVEGRGVPRQGYNITVNGSAIGKVTSGSFSPMLSKGIGMGYVEKEHSQIGTHINIDIRGKEIPAEIIKPPFV